MVSLLGLIIGFLRFSLKSRNVLKILIRMEFMVLMIFFCLIISVNKQFIFISLFFLIFRVCEGALGLTILVSIARVYGGDYLYILSLSH